MPSTLATAGLPSAASKDGRLRKEADLDAFLEFWSDDCPVEGPEHLLHGQQELGDTMDRAWAAMQPLLMSVSSGAVAGQTIFYEWAFAAEIRASGDRVVQIGITAHMVGADGRFKNWREYFDPPPVNRPGALEIPAVRKLVRQKESRSPSRHLRREVHLHDEGLSRRMQPV
jgi:limonene-1,2-epoxide hydrolase